MAEVVGSDPPRVLAELAALPDPLGAQARAYLDIVRYRSVGYDLCDKSCGEMPELLVRAIRSSLDGKSAEQALAQRAERERSGAESRESRPRGQIPNGLRSMYFLILCWPTQTFVFVSRSMSVASTW